jgi:hypothetical protein
MLGSFQLDSFGLGLSDASTGLVQFDAGAVLVVSFEVVFTIVD